MLDFSTENLIKNKKDNCLIFGVDEVGRGPLAGPVVAAAFWIDPNYYQQDFPFKELVRDSKKLSSSQREKIFQSFESCDFIKYELADVSNIIIDKINILQSSLLAMRLAVEQLREKMERLKKMPIELLVLIDGNKKIPKAKFEQRVFPGGDQKIFSIAAASICAKVARDRMMDQWHEKYPDYGFDRHRGYGTKFHYEMIDKYGILPIHRQSFNLRK